MFFFINTLKINKIIIIENIALIFASIIIGELADRGWGKSIFKSVFAMLIGLFVIYVCGIFQLSILKGFNFALLTGFYPFLLGDFYKLLLAGIVTPYIWKISK